MLLHEAEDKLNESNVHKWISRHSYSYEAFLYYRMLVIDKMQESDMLPEQAATALGFKPGGE